MSDTNRVLRDKTVFVTGGGSGLGQAICRCLGAAGARVVVGDLDQATAERCRDELRAAGATALSCAFDVADPGAVRRALHETVEETGSLYAVINDAAIDVTAPVDEIEIKAWHRVLMTNLFGPYVVAREAVPLMKAHGGGHIVNIASTAAKRAWPNASAYHATKWGLLGLSYALHAELRPYAIKVCAIVAGGMRTPFLLDRFPDIDPQLLQPPENVAETVRFVLEQPTDTVIPELMVLPMKETSWP
jgi:NAD(P)-dependent dehydrogenase (short-subunit alcohol dehydrogenase family)